MAAAASSGVAPAVARTGSSTGVGVTYPRLIIVKATYGLNKEIDVLEAVKKVQAQQDGGLSFPQKAEFNWTFGDPEPGANKCLKLSWKYGEDGDVVSEAWFENGGRKPVLLPKEDRPSDKYFGTLFITLKRAADVKEFGSKLKALYIKVECPDSAVKPNFAATKPADTKVNAKEPEWNQPISLTFEGGVDSKTALTVSLYEQSLFIDSLVARTVISLGAMSGARDDDRTIELFDDKTKKIPLAKLYFQAIYTGRGGPRAPRVPAAANAAGALR